MSKSPAVHLRRTLYPIVAGLLLFASATQGQDLINAIDSHGIIAPVETGKTGWKNQSVFTHDGVDAAESPGISDNEHASLVATVTGPDTLRFWWKVSSQQDNGYMVLWINEQNPIFITGEVDWQEAVVQIPAGEQLLRWEYGKFGTDNGNAGLDRGWLDEVYLESASPIPRIEGSLSEQTLVNTPFEYQITATKTPSSFTASPLPVGLGVDPNTGLISGTPTEFGRTTVNITASNSDGTASASLIINVVATLEDTFDNLGLIWNFSGDADWFEQIVTTHDGSDAAQSGDIGDSDESGLSTVITGPATVSFWWKVESESCCDPLTFSIDNQAQGNIRGQIDWQQQTFEIPAGIHTLSWVYSKDGSVSDGADAGWVDEITIIGSDSDSDGLEDSWELANFQNLDQSGSDDPDGDSFDNASEQAADTDPTDESSFFRITSVSQSADGSTQLTWKSSERRSYLIQSSSDLASGWTTVGNVIAGLPGETSSRVLPPGSTTSAQILVPENAPVKVTVPSSDIGILWRGGDEEAFAAAGGDTLWLDGSRGIGYENSNDGTFDGFFGTDLLGVMRGINTTAYMRNRFTLADPASVNSLLLQVRFDDAFVAFINGTEVARSAAAPGNLSFGARSTAGPDDDINFRNFDITGSSGALQAGENILAIHGLNFTPDSSDFLIVPKVTADVLDTSNAMRETQLFLRVLVVE